MARLPIPGSDDNTWGDILNEYLTVAHGAGGTLKSDAVNSTAIQDDSITVAKLDISGGADGQVLTKNSALSGGIEWTSAAGSPDATTSTKGLVQLAGDLGGTGTAAATPVISDNAITTAKINTGAVTGAKIANTTITDANISASATIAKSKLAALSIVDADVSAISESKVTNLTTDLAAKINASTITTKGDLLAATAASTVARLGVGSDGQVLTADSTQTTGIKWATPSGSGGTSHDVYPLSAYGFHSASANLGVFTGTSTIAEAWFVRTFVPAGSIINAIATTVQVAGTLGAGGLNSFAIYDDTGILVDSTTPDDTMWQTTGWIVKTLVTPIAAQGSDRFVYAAISSRGYTTPPNIKYNNTVSALTDGGGYLVNNRRVFLNSISSWPASFDPASYGSATGGFLPLVALG
jgi:hypothetical protein